MAGGKTSSHGVQRIKGRFGLPELAVDRQVNNALVRGTKRERFKGPLRKYLDCIWRKGIMTQAATDIRVYNDNIFLFAGQTLVTAWPLPERFIDGKEQRISGSQEAAALPSGFDQ